MEQNVNVTLAERKVSPVVHVVQGDTGRSIVAKVVDATISGTATMAFERPDSTSYTATATLNTTDNTVSAKLTSDMLRVAGNARMTFKITSSDGLVSTFQLIVAVEKSAGFEKIPASESNKIYVYINGSAIEVAKKADLDASVASLKNKINADVSDLETKLEGELSTEVEKLETKIKYPIDIGELNILKNGSFESGSVYPLDTYRVGWEDDTHTMPIYADMPTISSTEHASGSYSLHVNANGASQYGTLRGGKILTVDDEGKNVYKSVYACYGMTKVYVAFKINVTRWTAGRVGIQILGNSISQHGVTSGWVTKSYVFTNTNLTENHKVLLGAWKSELDGGAEADLEAYIDNLVIINLTKHPYYTKEMLDRAYAEQSIDLYKVPTASACMDAYADICAKQMKRYGLTNTQFATPSGQVSETSNGTTTCRDLIKLAFAVAGNKDVSRAMSLITDNGLYKYTPNKIQIKNIDKDKNIVDITNGGLDASSPGEISRTYFTCIEKGGTHKSADGDDAYAKTAICIAKIEGKLVAISVGDADPYLDPSKETSTDPDEPKWYAVWSLKIIADYVASKLRGETPSEPNIRAKYGAAVLVPDYPAGFAHLGETVAESLEYIYSKEPTTQFMPASTSKVAMALLASDYLDLEEMTELCIEDVSTMRLKYPGSACILDSRDSLVNRDLLYLAMMISSNQAANTLGRLIGKKALERKRV